MWPHSPAAPCLPTAAPALKGPLLALVGTGESAVGIYRFKSPVRPALGQKAGLVVRASAYEAGGRTGTKTTCWTRVPEYSVWLGLLAESVWLTNNQEEVGNSW